MKTQRFLLLSAICMLFLSAQAQVAIPVDVAIAQKMLIYDAGWM